VILTKEPLVPFLHHQEVKLAGLPVKVHDKRQQDTWERLSDFLGMEGYHHYCEGRVGTQFCSFAKKKSGRVEEWMMATHEERIMTPSAKCAMSSTIKCRRTSQTGDSTATKGTSVEYQIDVIREQHLLKYLELVDGELERTGCLLRRRHKAVRSAIDSIVAAAKRVTDPERKRDIMDYAR